jgi:periplasmic mercuric ion binding protein
MRFLLPVLLLGAGCSQGVSAPSLPVSAATTQTSLSIEGMTCASCETSIKIALSKLDGVSEVTVDYDTKSATVQHDPNLTSAQTLADSVTGLGYTTTVTDGAAEAPTNDAGDGVGL